jgi:hypothetical protein
MRVRAVLVVAVLAVVGALVLDLSGRAPRTSGSDHVSPVVFAAIVPGGGTLCQPFTGLPSDTADAQLLIGTYGYAAPELRLRFLNSAGALVASGRWPAGGPQGAIEIPLSHAHGEAVRACLRVGGTHKLAIEGEGGPLDPADEVVDGALQGGRISLVYFRPGRESWWQLLPTLSRRFGFGKALFFGSWTLPVLALVLVGVWLATARLLLRELT